MPSKWRDLKIRYGKMRGHGSSRALVFYLDHPPLETVTLGESQARLLPNGLGGLSVPPKSVPFCNPLLVTLYPSATREKLQMPSKLL
jgi:hypothetical protein